MISKHEIELSYKVLDIKGNFSVDKATSILENDFGDYFDGSQGLKEYLEKRLIRLNDLGLLLFDGFEFSVNSYK
jgi:hypothetical protein